MDTLNLAYLYSFDIFYFLCIVALFLLVFLYKKKDSSNQTLDSNELDVKTFRLPLSGATKVLDYSYFDNSFVILKSLSTTASTPDTINLPTAKKFADELKLDVGSELEFTLFNNTGYEVKFANPTTTGFQLVNSAAIANNAIAHYKLYFTSKTTGLIAKVSETF